MNSVFEWYAIRVTYGREVKLKEYLESNNIECFIPMRYTEVEKKDGSRVRKLESAVKNLIFIRSSRIVLDSLKQELEMRLPMRYIMDKSVGKPSIIPDKEMRNFIAVAGTLNEQLIYLNNIKPLLSKGERVRITGGVFSGVEGEIVRIKKDRRVMVCIKGVVAVATAFVHPSLLQKIECSIS